MKNTLPFGLNELFPNLAWAGALAVAAIAFLGAQPAHAAGNGTWNVDAAGSWVTAGNPPWLGSVVPGATSGTASTDTATFGFTLTAARTVTVDANRNIAGITFSNTSGFGYTLSGGNLLLSNGGVIQMLSSAGSHSEDIISPITIEGDGGAASFIDNAPSSGRFIVRSSQEIKVAGWRRSFGLWQGVTKEHSPSTL